MQKTAVVCVTNDLSTDQRVHKTCIALQKSGYWLVLTGRLLPESLPLERSYFTLRKKLWFRSGPQFYAEFNVRLFFYLMSKELDLIVANDLDTLPAAYLVAKLRNKKLLFDAHELFSEVPELVKRPLVKWFWQKTEDFILPQIANSMTVCQSIADYYHNKYNIDMKVVRNVPLFRISQRTNKLAFPNKKIILYQGALNVGRGLEWVLNAMPMIDNAMLVIIGNGDICKQLEELTASLRIQDKVQFTGAISGELLHEYTASADIGLCLLEEMGLNYYYALPNRIFDYIQAGVPVLATSFPEIANVVDTYKTGVLIDHYEPVYLAETINNMLANPIDTTHFAEVSKELCWENEEKVLLEILNK
jgi:glycosyltransferase involved in cell wall biosynthesis